MLATPFFALQDIDTQDDFINILLTADFGIGKTYLAATAAQVKDLVYEKQCQDDGVEPEKAKLHPMGDVLFISLEGGEKTLKKFKHMKNIKVIKVQNYAQYSYIYEFLKKHIEYRDLGNITQLRNLEIQFRAGELLPKVGWKPSANATTNEKLVAEMNHALGQLLQNQSKCIELVPEPMQFRTVIMDSLTEAQKYCMYQLLNIDPMTFKLDKEPESAQYQDWGRSREMINFLVRRMRDLRIHTISTTGIDMEKDSRNQLLFTPLLPGKLSNDVRGLVDVVAFMTNIQNEGGKTRRVFLESGNYGGNIIKAKHRFTEWNGNFIDNITMQDIWNLDHLDDLKREMPEVAKRYLK